MGDRQASAPLHIPHLPGAAEITIKKSTFLAQVHACQEVEGLKSMVQERRTRHFKARHVAWAAVIGPRGQQIPRYSDDGEPSGTAGRPILSILQKQDRTHTLVTVVRYFGGIKLGTGGLVKAYSEAAKQALEATQWEPLLSKIVFQLITGYGQWPLVEPALHHHGVEVLDTGFTGEVRATGRIVETEFTTLERDLINLCGGHIRIVPSPP